MTFEQIKEILVLVLSPLGVLAGVWLTFYLSEKVRKRDFAADTVMNKKITLYEVFYKLMSVVNENASDLFKAAKNHDAALIEKLHNKSFMDCMKLMQFCDDHHLYLDEDVVIHVGAMCMIPSEVIDMDINASNFDERIDELNALFRQDYTAAVELIKEYMGIKRLEKSFKKINKPKATSNSLDYARKLKKEYKQ